MLKLLLGTDWVANRNVILNRIAADVKAELPGRILMVPELISHDTERRLCIAAGDTASRFAEVLTFTRLASRVSDNAGRGALECLDDGGRLVAMASAVHQVQSRLKAYASVGTRPEFFISLIDAVDEFKRCCIKSGDLIQASAKLEGSLAQKLEELALILESYDSICQRGKRDPRDQMAWVLEELEQGNYAQNHVFYIDGFPDFTRQHMKILEHLIQNAPCVTVSLNCDSVKSTALAFEKAGETAAQLVRIAQKHNVHFEMEQIQASTGNLAAVRSALYQGEIPFVPSGVSLYRTQSVYGECTEAAERILSLVHDGARYRDIGIVCANPTGYRNTLEMICQRCRIPLYLSGTENILEKPVIGTVLSAMDTALGGFEQKDVLKYLKTSLSPLDMDTCDQLENYVILWGIDGNRWLQSWTYNPDGLGNTMSDSARLHLERMNKARQLAITPLVALRKGMLSAKNVSEQIKALYHFFEDVELAEHLSSLADTLDARGDYRNGQILNQLWEILLGALEQMYDVLGETYWEPETFSRLFKLLLSQYSVGTIPPVLDAVMAGSVSSMRCQQMKHLFVLGAEEGTLPGYSGSSGILTDQERNALRTIGVPLTGGSVEGLQAEFAEIYGVFCGASQSITVSCGAGQPSFVYRRLLEMVQGDVQVQQNIGAALVDIQEASAFLARNQDRDAAIILGLSETFEDALKKKNYTFGDVAGKNIEYLYGNRLRLSASQVDKQADCRFAYFLRYGLRVKECKAATIDPAEFGTYVHAVLEATVKEVMSQGGFSAVSLSQTQAIAKKYSDAYAKIRFSELDTDRLNYLFKRNGSELKMIIEELWQELRESEFQPAFFELQFDEGASMPPIEISGKSLGAQLRGFVDRVDVWKAGEENYFRVIDYKTGQKDFDYCDIFNGLGLQMLLYMFALEQNGAKLLGSRPNPAGVQYFPARAPMIAASGRMSQEDADKARAKIWKRRGLLLNNEAVLAAMEPSEQPMRLPYKRSKDGSLSGDLAGKEQFHQLKQYVMKQLADMVEEIASGRVTPNPYTRGDSHNACRYCPYAQICKESSGVERRNYKTMSADDFWTRIRREVNENGR